MTNGVTVTLIEEYIRKHEQRMSRYMQFLQKPTADGTQENLLDRLEQLIYRTSMVSGRDVGRSGGVSNAAQCRDIYRL